jgi:RimJ/RimL family protein N-acetyltransferase
VTRVPELSTPRLVLRPITLADAPALAGIYADPEVVRFLTPLDAAGTEAQVAMFVAEWQERGYGIMAVLDRETGRFLGRSGLHYWPRFDEIEAGWVLHRDTWGNGYATEAGAATLRWAFEDLGLDLVTAIVARANAASIAVTRRLGMSPLRDDVVNDCPVTVFAARAPRAAGKMHADEIDVSAGGPAGRTRAVPRHRQRDLPARRRDVRPRPAHSGRGRAGREGATLAALRRRRALAVGRADGARHR